MVISATIKNSAGTNTVTVATESQEKVISLPAKAQGGGAAINGGELLFLSLATCFCNDVYREAAKRNMPVDAVEVTVSGHFGKEGEPASGITYQVRVDAKASSAAITDLIAYVDKVAEVHNTLRQGVAVTLQPI